MERQQKKRFMRQNDIHLKLPPVSNDSYCKEVA